MRATVYRLLVRAVVPLLILMALAIAAAHGVPRRRRSRKARR